MNNVSRFSVTWLQYQKYSNQFPSAINIFGKRATQLYINMHRTTSATHWVLHYTTGPWMNCTEWFPEETSHRERNINTWIVNT